MWMKHVGMGGKLRSIEAISVRLVSTSEVTECKKMLRPAQHSQVPSYNLN